MASKRGQARARREPVFDKASDLHVSAEHRSAPADAKPRVAFVAGNGTYKNVPPLPNAPLSARAMASLLREAGFDVVEGIDLTRDRMTEKLQQFGEKADGAEIATGRLWP